MADEVIKACIDRLLPDHLRILAAQNAVKENPANAPVPKELTTGGFQVGWNKVLSATDIAFMEALYPFASKG